MNLLRDVVLHAEEIDRPTLRIEQWRDVELVVEERAVLAVIAQRHLDRLAFHDRFAQSAQALLVAVVPLQEPAIAADNLFLRVAGDLFEASVGVNDGRVLEIGIGERDAIDAGVENLRQYLRNDLGFLAQREHLRLVLTLGARPDAIGGGRHAGEAAESAAKARLVDETGVGRDLLDRLRAGFEQGARRLDANPIDEGLWRFAAGLLELAMQRALGGGQRMREILRVEGCVRAAHDALGLGEEGVGAVADDARPVRRGAGGALHGRRLAQREVGGDAGGLRPAKTAQEMQRDVDPGERARGRHDAPVVDKPRRPGRVRARITLPQLFVMPPARGAAAPFEQARLAKQEDARAAAADERAARMMTAQPGRRGAIGRHVRRFAPGIGRKAWNDDCIAGGDLFERGFDLERCPVSSVNRRPGGAGGDKCETWPRGLAAAVGSRLRTRNRSAGQRQQVRQSEESRPEAAVQSNYDNFVHTPQRLANYGLNLAISPS